MAKKTNYYYVLVITNYGPVFVTGIPERNTAEWKKTEPPMDFSREYARDMVLGLGLNGYLAYSVCQPYKLENQPLRYELGKMRFEFTGNGMDDVIGWISEHKTVYADFKKKFPELIEEE